MGIAGGPAGSPGVKLLSPPEVPGTNGYREDRAILCDRANFFGTAIGGCSTHVGIDRNPHDGVNTTVGQRNDAELYAESFINNNNLAYGGLGGDFNLTPGSMGVVYSGRHEADLFNQATKGSQKLDYAFVSASWFQGRGEAGQVFTHVSDHKALFGHFLPK